MTIYIVQEVWQEGSYIIAVFSTSGKAEAYKNGCDAINPDCEYSIEEHKVLQ